MKRLFRLIAPTLYLTLVVASTSPLLHAQTRYQTPPETLARLVDAPATPSVSLSPDESTLIVMNRPGLPSIEEVAAPEWRIAGVRINPAIGGPSRSTTYTGLTFVGLDGSSIEVSGLPEEARIRNVRWAPNSVHVAFTIDLPDRINLFVVKRTDGIARQILVRPINNTFSSPFSWMPDGRALIVRTFVTDRGTVPTPPAAPVGPVIQENIGKVAPARTYQDLLKNPFDEQLFEYYFTSELWTVRLDAESQKIGEPALYRYVAPSPDGRFLLVDAIHRPFSYLVPYYRFPHTVTVVQPDGSTVASIADLPLAEEVPTAFGSVATGPRSIDWRTDTGATLFWAEALDGGDAGTSADLRDRVFLLNAPFTGDPVTLIDLPLRFGGISWLDNRRALVSESWWMTRKRRTYVVDPSDPGASPALLFDLSSEDRYGDPGRPLFRQNDMGARVVKTSPDGRSIYLTGAGASPEGNRPFLRRLDLATGSQEELFRSQEPYYEVPVALLDDGSMITRRETNDEPSNYYLRTSSGTETALTSFPHPYPELLGIQKVAMSYTRKDGLPLSAVLYLPADYVAERDGPLPALVWAYPREFKSARAAGQRSDSPYRFKSVSYWGAVPFVTQGYAVINNASMPIVGEGDDEPNDTFIEQLVMNAKAAIEEGARRGVVDSNRVAIGGHSYGAFMAANLLAHSDLFRAGIARSGAYNRTLTPFGFQSEQRTYWEDPEIYFEMSPFMHADDVNEPILLIHGEADNNSGTFPIQSKRYYAALKGLGKTARLVMLPAESHGYRARESIMHMLWETNRWLSLYVKNARPRQAVDVQKTTGSH